MKHIALPNQLDLIGENVKVLNNSSDVETHAVRVKYATSGDIDYKYIPVKVAYAAPELLELLKIAKEELQFLHAQDQNGKFWSEESEMNYCKIREAITKLTE